MEVATRDRDRVVWVLRIGWFVLPLVLGRAVAASLDARLVDGSLDRFGQSVLLGTGWVLWGVGLVAAAVLLPVSLTVIRCLAVGSVAVAAANLVWGTADALAGAGLVVAAAAAGVAMLAPLGDRFVDGASYGDERRMLLRPPARFMVGVVPAVWGLWFVSVLAGPLLLANRRWVLGPIAIVVGLALAAVAGRGLHQLSRRWVVFVPTGFVLHDLMALTEPVLFRRTAVERLGPAIVNTPARDLSLGAAGLILECELADPAPLGLATGTGRTPTAELTDVRRFLFAPTRPGELLDEAERRRIAVDQSDGSAG